MSDEHATRDRAPSMRAVDLDLPRPRPERLSLVGERARVEPLDPARHGPDLFRLGHDGSAAARSAESLHARAYTVGRDIVFNHGQLTTSSIEGRRLLGHELAHVAQQAVSGRMVQRQGARA
jgi:hypothetical protein